MSRQRRSRAMFAIARSSRPASAMTGGSVSGTSSWILVPRGPRLRTAAGMTSSRLIGERVQLERSRLQAAHVEEVADEGVEAVGLLVDRREELVLLGRSPVDVSLQQARHRGLDRRERSAQVVRDGGEERRSELVRRREGSGGGRLGLELLDLDRRCELARERLEDRLVAVGRGVLARQHEHVSLVDVDGRVRVGRGCRAQARWPPRASSSTRCGGGSRPRPVRVRGAALRGAPRRTTSRRGARAPPPRRARGRPRPPAGQQARRTR